MGLWSCFCSSFSVLVVLHFTNARVCNWLWNPKGYKSYEIQTFNCIDIVIVSCNLTHPDTNKKLLSMTIAFPVVDLSELSNKPNLERSSKLASKRFKLSLDSWSHLYCREAISPGFYFIKMINLELLYTSTTLF